ncbi:Spo0B domain-containing protein [Anaeroselena agilis]|uniref:Spo0B domain-containing protein n=1 Tax=Anaeroselena agilis TaxID=3063788 RepID=A0ABU3P0N0_9FIRM|nr:Spo0B domain-containing protein [Selenomonadales bacterium 4137-cl]
MAEEVCEELVRALRAQRHDFINHIQVVHALLQLGRTEKALAYLDDLAKDPEFLAGPLRQHVRQPSCRRTAGS